MVREQLVAAQLAREMADEEWSSIMPRAAPSS
jgi:hypothetical protein